MFATHSTLQPVYLPEREALYSAFGLRIRSEIPLPEFERISIDGDGCDVTVAVHRGEQWSKESSWSVNTHEARFWYPNVGSFRVMRGSEIIVGPEPYVDDALLRMYVEGMMFATLLYQRGYFVLHASVVRIGDSCVAMLGHVGAGKSSTAAALYARGHAVVSDDNAAISFTGDVPMIRPAFPYVKMFSGVAASLGYHPGALHRMHSSQPKFASDVSAAFPRSPVRLAGIYVLSRDAAESVTSLNATETTIELVRNSVPTRWKLPGTADHLRQSTELARRIPAYRVRTFTRLEELPVLAETIERHAMGAARA
jgi:hypothetical protein